MGDKEEYKKLRRIVRRIAQAPDAAGDAIFCGLGSVEGPADFWQAGVRTGLVVPSDRARFIAAPPVKQGYDVSGHSGIVSERSAEGAATASVLIPKFC